MLQALADTTSDLFDGYIPHVTAISALASPFVLAWNFEKLGIATDAGGIPSPIFFGVTVFAVLLALTMIALPNLIPALRGRASRLLIAMIGIPALLVSAGLLFMACSMNSVLHILAFCCLIGSLVVTYTLYAPLSLLSSPEPVRQHAFTPAPNSNGNTNDNANTSETAHLLQRARRSFKDIHGMTELKAELSRAMEPFRAFAQKGSKPADRNGILLSGPPGNGKTVIAEAIAGELGYGFMKIGVGDITSKWINESASKITAVVDAAIAAAPCVLFIDEIDAVARNRGSGNMHNEDIKAINTWLQQITRVRDYKVLLVAATNCVDDLDPAMMRDGRFDYRIEVPNPDLEARLGIFKGMITRFSLDIAPDDVSRTAKNWEHRSASFIEGVSKRLRDDFLGKRISLSDLKQTERAVSRRVGAIPKTGPALSNIYLSPNVRVEVDSIVHRLGNYDRIVEQGGMPPKGILLYGPPGTGKTMLVNAMARELGDWHVFEAKAAEIMADPRKFKDLMSMAIQHRPAIVFLDEADGLLQDRGFSPNPAATNEILKAMDGVMGSVPEVVFVAATNNPDAIDAAAKRGGRFGEKIYMGLLEGNDLVQFIDDHIAKTPGLRLEAGLTGVQIAAVIGASGPADILAILGKSVNYTFTATGRRDVELADVIRATESMRSS